MDKNIITETVNGVTNYISLNGNGELVKAAKNPMELSAFMTKEQAFKVIGGLRQAAAGTETKYRVKAVSQALRDMITDIIYNQLPEAPVVAEEVVTAFAESMKPAVKQEKASEEPVEVEAEAEKEQPAEPEQTEPVTEEPAKSEAKAAKKAKKQSK